MKKKQVQVDPITNTLYEKRGNKYVPAAEYFTTDYWHNGSYIVNIRPGMRSMYRLINPVTTAEVEAALKVVGDGMMKAFIEKRNTPSKPKPEHLTPKQKKALQAWKEAFGDDFVWFPSQQEIVEAGLDELRKYFQDNGKCWKGG